MPWSPSAPVRGSPLSASTGGRGARRASAAPRGTRGAWVGPAAGGAPLPPGPAPPPFARLLAAGHAQAAVADIDWPVFSRHLGRPVPFYAGLAPAPSPAAPETPASVAAGSPADQRARVIALVRERITRELGFPELIDTRH